MKTFQKFITVFTLIMLLSPILVYAFSPLDILQGIWQNIVNLFFGTTDTYEPNNIPEQAYGPLTPEETYESYIWSADDKDDYYYIVADQDTIAVELTNIPSGTDYDLYLYDSDKSLVDVSKSLGSVNEKITYNPTRSGKYYIRVNPYEGFDNNHAYSLVARFGETTETTTTIPETTTTIPGQTTTIPACPTCNKYAPCICEQDGVTKYCNYDENKGWAWRTVEDMYDCANNFGWCKVNIPADDCYKYSWAANYCCDPSDPNADSRGWLNIVSEPSCSVDCGCHDCLESGETCHDACRKAFGDGCTGTCGNPGSKDPGACCECHWEGTSILCNQPRSS